MVVGVEEEVLARGTNIVADVELNVRQTDQEEVRTYLEHHPRHELTRIFHTNMFQEPSMLTEGGRHQLGGVVVNHGPSHSQCRRIPKLAEQHTSTFTD